ncbi:MAG: ABC transporter substrate-binding protein [Acidimicrobiales bacterium]
MSAPVVSSDPPRGYFSVWQRLMRGYGPLAVFALMLLLLSVLVPSKVPDDDAQLASGPSLTDGTTDGGIVATDGTTDGAVATDGATTDGATTGGDAGGTTGGSTGGTGGAPAAAMSCPDRELQVPGDPYSPPCKAFSGSNGGATHKGVTGTSIKVAFRVLNERGFQQTLADLAGASLVDSPDTVKRTVQTMADYFNKRFQLYGRKIEIVFYNGQGSNTNELLGKGRDKAEADAIKVAEEIGAFADISATSEPYAGALAKRGVIGFGTPYLSRAWHEQRAPFAWSLATDGSIVSELAAEYQVQRLYGKPAIHAGGKGGDGKDLKGRPRKFATLAPENSWYQESVQNAEAIIRKAGQQPGFNRKYVLDLATMSDQATGIIAQMKNQNITTIVCGCDPILPVFLSGVANREKYYPEFIIVGTALTDADIVAQLWRPEFAEHAFGVSPLNGFVPPTQTIAYAAYKDIRNDEPAFSVDLIYYQMYMLAIGLQGAGPTLNPSTFEQGMFAYPPKVGPFGLWKFGPGDRTAANDVREIYFDPNATSTYNGKKGAYIGTSPQRWESGKIPAGNPGKPS